MAGVGFCDDCYKGYVVQSSLCVPCATNCDNCNTAGPGLCDLCADGYMLEPVDSLCIPCTANCRKCHDQTESGCDDCFFWHQLQLDGSCSFRIRLAGIIGAVLSSLSLLGARACRRARSRAVSAPRPLAAVPDQEAFVRAHLSTLETAPPFPSGLWRGYYNCAGTRHDVCEFNLQFDGASGNFSGSGVDDVGSYSITGIQHGTRMAFSKAYLRGSKNIAGVVSYGNQGHNVEYRGEMAGPSLGEGIRGCWSIRSSLGNDDGDFHLWPAMAGWSDQRQEARTFSESECVVCYDRPISVCLRPCGHVALCGMCASRLNPRKCPLCRVSITSMESSQLPKEDGKVK